MKKVNVETANFGTLTVLSVHEDELKTYKVGDSIAILMFNAGCEEGLHLLTKTDDTTYEDKFIGYENGKVQTYIDSIDCNFNEDNGDENLYYWLAEIRQRELDVVVELTPELKARFDAITK